MEMSEEFRKKLNAAKIEDERRTKFDKDIKNEPDFHKAMEMAKEEQARRDAFDGKIVGAKPESEETELEETEEPETESETLEEQKAREQEIFESKMQQTKDFHEQKMILIEEMQKVTQDEYATNKAVQAKADALLKTQRETAEIAKQNQLKYAAMLEVQPVVAEYLTALSIVSKGQADTFELVNVKIAKSGDGKSFDYQHEFRFFKDGKRVIPEQFATEEQKKSVRDF